MSQILSCNQAVTPEEATMYETAAAATREAEELLPVSKAWRVDGFQSGGETLCIVKHWPRHKTEICAERRWLKIAETKPRRKK